MNVIKAIQSIYPDIKGGFMYWETKQDGTPLDNPIDGLAWENIEYSKPTWEQIESELDAIELLSYKEARLKELKNNRNNDNLKDIEAKASEVEYSDSQFIETNNIVTFRFGVKSTGQPATEPNSIILGVLIASASVPDFYVRYSCKIIDGDNIRKGYIALNAATALNIQSHLQVRNQNNIAFTNDAESQINNIQIIEDEDPELAINLEQAKALIDAIDINFE